ncbi:hypothetical protein Y032_0106g3777 [Ancylostoma ceylanicum]|uniref:Fungal lipase-type domain-containing protein n=1 Tax=Ancylostoma ceylanicum TaxID=53326 RepID=A0A016TFX6_9BILA|nr:hypothetical protein Y032_0106g3777 [Ancylostoma ceylanicum]
MIALVILFLAVSGSSAAKYSDSFSRKFMFPLSAAAYSGWPQGCINRLFSNSTVYRQIEAPCDQDTCSGFTAVLHPQKAIVLSFRGTTSILQLIQEINKTVFVSWYRWLFGGQVSMYFGDAFVRIWNHGMGEDFVALRKMYPDYEIWVTGHSLGGAIASLASSYIIAGGYADAKKTKLVTFGQPRTGDVDYSAAHNTQAEYSFRVTHYRDIVPHIPMGKSGGYHHHQREAFYQRGMKSDEFKVCEGNESKDCSNGLYFTNSIKDHTHYFGRQVSEYGISGCV